MSEKTGEKTGDNTDEILTRGISSFVVTTDDVDRAKTYFLDGLKLHLVDERAVDGSVLSLWGLERTRRAKSWIFKRHLDDRYAWFRLVEIENAGGHDIRAGAMAYDFGVFDLAFGVRDIAAKVEAIQKLGYDVPTPPVVYDAPRYPHLPPYKVSQAVVSGPNAINIVMIETLGFRNPDWRFDEQTGFAGLTDSAQMLRNFDDAVHFYHELLGLPNKGTYKAIAGPQFDAILKIGDTPMDMCRLADLRLGGAAVEPIAPLWDRGKEIAGQRSVLNYGVAALSFETADVDLVFRRMEQASVEIVARPATVQLDGVGAARAFSCYGPHNVLCEIYQCV